jgi:hypothetical protein
MIEDVEAVVLSVVRKSQGFGELGQIGLAVSQIR